MNKSSTLYLTCGLPGSGKTTLAKQLEQAGLALRLTGDEWLQELFPNMSTAEAETGPFRSRVERLQWLTAVRALELGCNVVVDWGVWAREERDVFRVAAREVGARVVLCLLDPPIDELWSRVSHRNADRPFGVFEITRADLIRWSELFQRPTADELALYDVCETWDHPRPPEGILRR
jgi:predicted kinase